MTRMSRFLFRARRRFLHCYEAGMFAMLFAVAIATAVPGTPAAQAPAAHCGNIQSSTVVMHR